MDSRELLRQGLETAVAKLRPAATAYVDRLRRIHPGKSPEEIARMLARGYLAAVSVSGAASGAAGVPAALADVAVFADASALYVLSLAEVHGLGPDDQRPAPLVAAALARGAGANVLKEALRRAVPFEAKGAALVPRGVAAVVGAGGNCGFGWLTVASARKAFGPLPAAWPDEDPFSGGNVRILDGPGADQLVTPRS